MMSTRTIYVNLYYMEVLLKLYDNLLEDQCKCPPEFIDIIHQERIELRRDMKFINN
jgi:hypothetical protein